MYTPGGVHGIVLEEKSSAFRRAWYKREDINYRTIFELGLRNSYCPLNY